MAENPPGGHLLNQVEAAAETWTERFHDALTLADEKTLDHLRRYLPARSLSDRVVAYGTASAAQRGSVDHMIHWGRLCSRRPKAAAEVALALLNPQRRPRLRLAHVIAQFREPAKTRAITRLVEQRVDPGLVQAIRDGAVPSYVREKYRELQLDEALRDTLLHEFESVRL